jgi:hypothetical protein
MKLAVNSLIHGINQTLSEAMTLAEAAGIGPETAFDVIEASPACAPMLTYRRPLYLDEAAHDVTFTVALARKDMEVTAALARGLGCSFQQLLHVLSHGCGDEGHTRGRHHLQDARLRELSHSEQLVSANTQYAERQLGIRMNHVTFLLLIKPFKLDHKSGTPPAGIGLKASILWRFAGGHVMEGWRRTCDGGM